MDETETEVICDEDNQDTFILPNISTLKDGTVLCIKNETDNAITIKER